MVLEEEKLSFPHIVALVATPIAPVLLAHWPQYLCNRPVGLMQAHRAVIRP